MQPPFWLNAAPPYKNLAARVWGGGLHLAKTGAAFINFLTINILLNGGEEGDTAAPAQTRQAEAPTRPVARTRTCWYHMRTTV